MPQNTLSAALRPRSIVVIGASSHPASRGYHVWRSVSLSPGLKRVWAVNPKYRFVGDHPCFPNADAVPDRDIDLAILCVSRKHLAEALRKLRRNPPKAVLFAPQEEGPLSDALEISELRKAAREMGSRLLGPNSIGVIAPKAGINASFWPRMPAAGGIALVAQSAMVATGLMDHADESSLGFTAVVNTGLEEDISLAEVIEHFAHDRTARVIAVEVEAIKEPRAFASALRAAADQKPVIVLRAGPGSGYAADRLAATRYGTDAGEDRAFDALLAATGALRVRTFGDFCSAAAAFSAGTLPADARAAIISNGSGFAALAADVAESSGVQIEGLGNRTIQRLSKAHPGERIPVNPVVIGASATGERFAETLGIVLDDPAIQGASVIVGPSPMSTLDPAFTAIAAAAKKSFKPVIVSWVSSHGTPAVRRQLDALPDSRVIAIRSPERAMKAFGLLAERSRILRERRALPRAARGMLSVDALAQIRVLFSRVLEDGRHFLLPWEVRALLNALGLPTVPARLVSTLEDAQKAALELGWPLAIKASSEGLGSRSASGLVFLSLRSPEELARAWEKLTGNLTERTPLARPEGILVERMSAHSIERELMLRIRLDAVLGPVIEFGGAGLAGASHGDVAVGLPPLSLAEAERLAHEPRASVALGAYRGLPEIDWTALVTALCRLSDLAAAVPALRELRLEPVVAGPGGLLVLNAEAALYDAPLEPDRGYGHLTLRPAALESAEIYTDPKGERFTLRALTEDDCVRFRTFISSLSEQSFYYRFHTAAALSDERIAQMLSPDWSRSGAWVLTAGEGENEVIAASGRWSLLEGTEAEFGVATRDDYQRRGLARVLMAKLEREAALEGFNTMTGFVLPGNEPMERFMQTVGYTVGEEVTGAEPRRWSRRLTTPGPDSQETETP